MSRKSCSSLDGAAASPVGIASAQAAFIAIPISPIPTIPPIFPIPPAKLPFLRHNGLQLRTTKAALLLVELALLVHLAWSAAAQPAVITKLELYTANQVLVHLDIQANTTCSLQYTDLLSTNSASVTWSNLYAPPNLPFFEHYIIVDTRTSRQRFYRLLISR